jgi:hypothetical protein
VVGVANRFAIEQKTAAQRLGGGMDRFGKSAFALAIVSIAKTPPPAGTPTLSQ